MITNGIRGMLITCYVFIGFILMWPFFHATKYGPLRQNVDVEEANAMVSFTGFCFHVGLLSIFGIIMRRYKKHSLELQ